MIRKNPSTKKSKRPFLKADNQHLLQEFSRGSAGAFREVYLQFKKPIQKMVSSRISNADIVEELVQETFLKVFRYRQNYDPKYEFSTWIWTIAKNLTFDYLSQTKGDPLDTKGSLESDDQIQSMPCDRLGAEMLLFAKAERRTLFQLLKKLPKLQRKALLMRALKGCSYDEIANSLKLSLSAVKSLIHRGKLTLQSSMRLKNTIVSEAN